MKRCKHTKSKTYREWGRLGYHVIRGQKATGRNADGTCTFKRSQVALNDYSDNVDPTDNDFFEAIFGHDKYY